MSPYPTLSGGVRGRPVATLWRRPPLLLGPRDAPPSSNTVVEGRPLHFPLRWRRPRPPAGRRRRPAAGTTSFLGRISRASPRRRTPAEQVRAPPVRFGTSAYQNRHDNNGATSPRSRPGPPRTMSRDGRRRTPPQVRRSSPAPSTRHGVLYHRIILGFFGAGPAVQNACGRARPGRAPPRRSTLLYSVRGSAFSPYNRRRGPRGPAATRPRGRRRV